MMMRKPACFFSAIAVTLVLCFLLPLAGYACTGVYVGKNVSENGAIIIARTRDSNKLESICRRIVNPRIENQPGRIYHEINGFQLDLPATTYQYLSGPLSTSTGRGTFGASCINEKGLAVTATVTARTREEAEEADPFVPTGISEACIGDIVAMCCATAREGIEFLGKVIMEHGNAEPNIIMIADSDEAWYMETYTGYQWAAVKMPSDQMAVFGNGFMLDPLHESYEEILYSPACFTMPEEKKIAVHDENDHFDLFGTYVGKQQIKDYANMRTWYGHKLYDITDPCDYVSEKKYDLFFRPKNKIGVADIEELDRSRFEGTDLCPDIDGRADRRIIGIETQYSVDITEIYADLPKPMSVISWVCLDNAEHSVFLPYSNLLTHVSPDYSKDVSEGFPFADDSIAFYAYQNLCVLSITGRASYGRGVRSYWRSVEDHLLATYPQVIAKTRELYDRDPDAAAEYMTTYSEHIQNTALSDARQLKNELLHYLALNQRTFDYKTQTEASGQMTRYEHPPFEASMIHDIADRYSVSFAEELLTGTEP